MQTSANTVGLCSTQEPQCLSQLLSQRSTYSRHLPAIGGKQVLKMPKHRRGWNETGIWDLKHPYLRTNPICLINVMSPSKVNWIRAWLSSGYQPDIHSPQLLSVSKKTGSFHYSQFKANSVLSSGPPAARRKLLVRDSCDVTISFLKHRMPAGCEPLKASSWTRRKL